MKMGVWRVYPPVERNTVAGIIPVGKEKSRVEVFGEQCNHL